MMFFKRDYRFDSLGLSLIIVALLSLPLGLFAYNFEGDFFNYAFSFKAGYFMPSDEGFSEIFGSGGFSPGFAFQYNPSKNLQIDLRFHYLSVKGETVVTEPVEGVEIPSKEVKFSTYPLSAGLRYVYNFSKSLSITAGGDLIYQKWSEDVSGWEPGSSGSDLGFGVQVGASWFFTRFFFAEFLYRYSSVSAKGEEAGAGGGDVDIGGNGIFIGVGRRY